MKELFIEKKFTEKNRKRIKQINYILDQYEEQGYSLTLRQLYYQLVSKNWIENTIKSYNRLGDLVTNARQAGLIDWDMIIDRNRVTQTKAHWDTPADILLTAAQSFALDRWKNQSCYVEVLVEKDALSGVLAPVCKQMDIPFTACKGYPSSSMLYGISQRLKQKKSEGKELHIIHLGDHDPSMQKRNFFTKY